MGRSFNILDPTLNLRRNYLVEASAGTGKTYTIEHLVIRLLIDEKTPLTFDQILVVTFTKAAVNELRLRVRRRLESCLCALKERDSKLPYLQELIFGDEERRQKAIWKIENALYCFEEGNLLTIHSFCAQVLREHRFEGVVNIDEEKGMISPDLVSRVIKDHFRLFGHFGLLSEGQMKRLLKKHWGSFEKLEKSLFRVLIQPLPIQSGPLFSEYFVRFRSLRDRLRYDPEYLLEDFNRALPHYKGVKEEDREKAVRFLELFRKDKWTEDDFDQLIVDGIVMTEMCLKKRCKFTLSDLQYPDFIEVLKVELTPLIDAARDPLNLFAIMAHHCQKLLHRYLEKEEIYPYDSWLTHLLNATDNVQLLSSMRKRFQAVIIDEFQDTDPIQWAIFQKIFVDHSLLYLVGDPKQSIYAFRSADLYTYLEAALTLGKEAQVSLDVNYRSSPQLIAGLNDLFGRGSCFHLPRTNQVLDYPLVTSGSASDTEQAIHWMSVTLPEKKTTRPVSQKEIIDCEEKIFIPQIASKITQLKNTLPLDQMAVLVRDRFQGRRVKEILNQWGIPVVLQRTENLAESPAREALVVLLQAALHPDDLSHVKVAMGGRLIGWTLDELKSLDDPQSLEEVIDHWHHLHNRLIHSGMGPFMEHLLQTSFLGLHSIECSLLLRGEKTLFRDLEQIVEVMMDLQNRFPKAPSQWIDMLDRFEEFVPEGDEQGQRRQNPMEPGVRILTMHMSKGLEFDVVFPLGLISRTPIRDELIPSGRTLITPSADPDAYQLYLRELDAEKMRQLYVAVTRAKKQLYLPVLWTPHRKEPVLGAASPMELWCHALQITQDNPPIHSNIFWEVISDQNLTPPRSSNTHESINLIPPQKVLFTFPECSVNSFTSLSQPQHHPSELTPPHDFEAPCKSIHTLPAGSMTGELVHHLLEKLSWESHGEPHYDLTSYLAHTPYLPWKETLETLLATLFSTPLYPESFTLSDVHSHKVLREVDFMMDHRNNYLKGAIDCIFEHEGKTYIIDWKTNWLGPTPEAYSQENISRAMLENDYHLQGSIYSHAWKRYQKDRPFGGVFYLFVRGMDPASHSGIYHFFPEGALP